MQTGCKKHFSLIIGGYVKMCNDATVIIEPIEEFTTVVIENDCEEVTIVCSGLGQQGLSAYQIAVINGFEGTEAEWLESLKAVASLADIEDVSITTPLNKQGLYYNTTTSEWENGWTWFQYASGFTQGTRPTLLSDTSGTKIFEYTYSFGTRYRKLNSTIDGFFTDLACTELIVKKEI